MRTPTWIATAAILFALTPTGPAGAGTIHMRPYFDANKSEVILVWDEATGKSNALYYDKAENKFMPSAPNFQLPAKTGIQKNVMMAPYLGPDGSEVILIWNKKTGRSVSWYFDKSEDKFVPSHKKYQLPKQNGKEVMLAPYVAKGDSEVILAWDVRTGKNISWYYDDAGEKYIKADEGYQLPAKLGLKGRIMMMPYFSKDGSEVIHIWSVTNGKSINYYFDNAENKFIQSDKEFQLPAKPGITKNVWMSPYTGNDGSEIILVWDKKSGKSVNWYHDNADKIFKKSKPEFQLPAKPLKAKGVRMVPYLDTDASEVILVWNPRNGTSKSYYFDEGENKMVPAGMNYQLPQKPLK